MLALQTTSRFESFGGIEYYIDDFLTHAHRVLARSGDPVTSLIAQRGPWRDLETPYAVHPIPMQKHGWRSKLDNRLSPRLFFRALAELRRRPQPILFTHVSLGPMAYALHCLTGLPFYGIVYGIEAWGDLSPWNEMGLRRASGIFSISHWTKQVLVDRGYNPDRIQIVHPQLSPEFSQLPTPTRVARLGPLKLLTVSRLDAREQYKGQDHVLEALSRLRKARPALQLEYTIQGDGDDRKRLESLVAEKHLEDRVRFQPGVRDRNDFIDAYRAHDLYVMPSRFGKWDGRWRGEGFGIVYLEAAALGIPSVAYRCGGAMDILVDGVTGRLLQPDNIDELATCLVHFAENRDELVRLGEAANRHVLNHFAPEAIHRELESAFAAFQIGVPQGNNGLRKSSQVAIP